MGLETNMFGQEKKSFLDKKGITHIHKLYTDSVTDKSLMDISENVYVIHQGRIIQSR